MTENEAREKLCPFRTENVVDWNTDRGTVLVGSANCIASDCMAWRWEDVEFDLPEPPLPSELEGYCGLAGKNG